MGGRPVRATPASEVEVSISYASDDIVPARRRLRRRHRRCRPATARRRSRTTATPSTAGPSRARPTGSDRNANDWIVGTAADAPPTLGEVAEGSFARQPEIIDFLEGYFGRYPFSAAGGIVDDVDGFGFALENQTRPIYAQGFFGDPDRHGDSVVVHELAHQWVGDDLAVDAWQHIWLNEGFATYTEWLWSEREGLGTAQEIFDSYAVDPGRRPVLGADDRRPGPGRSSSTSPVYVRGAMTLHALRLRVGDDDFFRILRRWVARSAGGNVTTDEFIALAERVSGQHLDELFDDWLFTGEKPAGLEPEGLRTRSAPPAAAKALEGIRNAVKR